MRTGLYKFHDLKKKYQHMLSDKINLDDILATADWPSFMKFTNDRFDIYEWMTYCRNLISMK